MVSLENSFLKQYKKKSKVCWNSKETGEGAITGDGVKNGLFSLNTVRRDSRGRGLKGDSGEEAHWGTELSGHGLAPSPVFRDKMK